MYVDLEYRPPQKSNFLVRQDFVGPPQSHIWTFATLRRTRSYQLFVVAQTMRGLPTKKNNPTMSSSVRLCNLWMWDTRWVVFFGVLYLLGRPEVGGSVNREIFRRKKFSRMSQLRQRTGMLITTRVVASTRPRPAFIFRIEETLAIQ